MLLMLLLRATFWLSGNIKTCLQSNNIKTSSIKSWLHGVTEEKECTGFIVVHNNKKEDRAWSWDCRRVLKHGYPKCRQTGYVNSFDKPMFFMCGRNQYIYGVESYHNNKHEDRRWKFTCCSASGHKTKSCRHTGFVNEFDRPLLFQARHKEVITGVYSYHNNRKE